MTQSQLPDDGGVAFPQPIATAVDGSMYCSVEKHPVFGGMTLRDYFAAMAMQGACISVGIEGAVHREMEVSTEDVARDAYKMADAMLKARKS